jgi:hypothetical protein
MATGFERARTVVRTVKSIFSDFCSPGVRSNARKKFKFEFSKTATVVCQDIGQGIKSYFCLEQTSCFAEIIFEFLGMVTVSDSIFG